MNYVIIIYKYNNYVIIIYKYNNYVIIIYKYISIYIYMENNVILQKDKIFIAKNIGKLEKSDQIELFYLLQNHNEKLYSINDKETLFDLDVLPYKLFYDIYNYIKLTLEHYTRENEKKQSVKEKDDIIIIDSNTVKNKNIIVSGNYEYNKLLKDAYGS